MHRWYTVPLLVQQPKSRQDPHEARSKRHLTHRPIRVNIYTIPEIIYRHTVPVATAVVCNTTFSCALMGLRSNLDIRNPIRADCRDILNGPHA